MWLLCGRRLVSPEQMTKQACRDWKQLLCPDSQISQLFKWSQMHHLKRIRFPDLTKTQATTSAYVVYRFYKVLCDYGRSHAKRE